MSSSVRIQTELPVAWPRILQANRAADPRLILDPCLNIGIARRGRVPARRLQARQLDAAAAFGVPPVGGPLGCRALFSTLVGGPLRSPLLLLALLVAPAR